VVIAGSSSPGDEAHDVGAEPDMSSVVVRARTQRRESVVSMQSSRRTMITVRTTRDTPTERRHCDATGRGVVGAVTPNDESC